MTTFVCFFFAACCLWLICENRDWRRRYRHQSWDYEWLTRAKNEWRDMYYATSRRLAPIHNEARRWKTEYLTERRIGQDCHDALTGELANAALEIVRWQKRFNLSENVRAGLQSENERLTLLLKVIRSGGGTSGGCASKRRKSSRSRRAS